VRTRLSAVGNRDALGRTWTYGFGHRSSLSAAMYQGCIKTATGGLCRPVRTVSVCADIAPGRSLHFDRFRYRPSTQISSILGFGSRRPRVRISLSRPHLPGIMLSLGCVRVAFEVVGSMDSPPCHIAPFRGLDGHTGLDTHRWRRRLAGASSLAEEVAGFDSRRMR